MRATLFQIAHDWTFALPVIAVPVMLGSKQTIGCAVDRRPAARRDARGSVRGLGEQAAIAATSRRWRTAHAYHRIAFGDNRKAPGGGYALKIVLVGVTSPTRARRVATDRLQTTSPTSPSHRGARRVRWHECWKGTAPAKEPSNDHHASHTARTLPRALRFRLASPRSTAARTKAPSTRRELITHPDEDIAGSQIRLVEGEDAPVAEAVRHADAGPRRQRLSGQRQLERDARQRRAVRVHQGDRGHDVQEPVLRAAVQRLVQRRHHPRRVSLRDAEHVERRRAGDVLRRTTAADGRATARRCRRRSTSSTTRTVRRATARRTRRWSRGSATSRIR